MIRCQSSAQSWITSLTGRRTAIGSHSRTAIDSKRTPSARGSVSRRAYATTGEDGGNRMEVEEAAEDREWLLHPALEAL